MPIEKKRRDARHEVRFPHRARGLDHHPDLQDAIERARRLRASSVATSAHRCGARARARRAREIIGNINAHLAERAGAVDGAELRAEHLGMVEREADAAVAEERVGLVGGAEIRGHLVAAQVHGAEDHRARRQALGHARGRRGTAPPRSAARRGPGRRTRCGTGRRRRRQPTSLCSTSSGSSMLAPSSMRLPSSVTAGWPQPTQAQQILVESARRAR